VVAIAGAAMRIWPVLLDSQPAYLQGRGRSVSLLLAPLGRQTLIEHLRSGLVPITRNSPMVLSPQGMDAEYRRWVRAVYPTARVMGGREDVADVLAGLELSDALLIVDPRCLPIRDLQLSELMRHYAAEPRVAHHLVAFETAVAGTKERVSFDTTGQVRGIHRYYEEATWPFIAGIAAAIVPVACGVLADGLTPASLAELRQILTARGVPIRDFAVEGGAHDLTGEGGLLAANEQSILKATDTRQNGNVSSAPIYVGAGHSIHTTARIVGAVVIHPDACIEDHATVLGPAVIGAGARIAAGAVVAHAVIGPDCTVPGGRIIRDRAWFQRAEEHDSPLLDHPALSYGDRLARLAVDTGEDLQDRDPDTASARRHLFLKRALDMTVASLSLAVLSPLLVVIAVLVWLDSKGPILYGDIREGLRGRVFRCWKFRTMYVGAHAAQRELTGLDQMDGPHFKLDRDPRVSRMGRVLRALNLDELPHVLNVLLGQMSLVGPRPSPFRENQICVPWREARLSVRPGITGFWQVCRHDRSAGDFHQWIEYDLLYVQHLSFWLDVKILTATLLTLGGKAAHVPAAWLVRPRSAGRDMGQAGIERMRTERESEQIVVM
jgi:lipopolysaccharide/colanic/teichoic acid biosynthesis glycosyltransferase/carbonic anhydrase/acetyltransferase-like protein (isoleucine patch superfamily)